MDATQLLRNQAELKVIKELIHKVAQIRTDLLNLNSQIE